MKPSDQDISSEQEEETSDVDDHWFDEEISAKAEQASPLINIWWLHPLLARYAQWNPGTNTSLETSTHKEGSQKNRILIFALYLQNEAKV